MFVFFLSLFCKPVDVLNVLHAFFYDVVIAFVSHIVLEFIFLRFTVRCFEYVAMPSF
uniref:Uncharacterized protein n=1 Tax=Rhizophora mucronata TaxID=61149 RepID=A0A2P2QFM3_RHIMU